MNGILHKTTQRSFACMHTSANASCKRVLVVFFSSTAWQQSDLARARGRLRALGFECDERGRVRYNNVYAPPQLDAKELLMVPHGKTPSNIRMLFQSHAESADSQLLPASFDDARAGARSFLEEAGRLEQLRFVDCGGGDRGGGGGGDGSFVLLRSPLQRTAQTGGVYLEVMRARGLSVPQTLPVDPGLVEINHASWKGKTVEQLDGPDADEARAYRSGSFLASPTDGSGESLLDLLERCALWLQGLSRRYPDRRVLVFGHGTFQNAVETLLRTYGDREPAAIFSRISGGSHLRRGFVHAVYPPCN